MSTISNWSQLIIFCILSRHILNTYFPYFHNRAIYLHKEIKLSRTSFLLVDIPTSFDSFSIYFATFMAKIKKINDMHMSTSQRGEIKVK